MSNEIFPQIPNALDTGLPAVESATELPTSQTSAPELGGADVELQPDNVGQAIPEPFSTLPHLVETSRKPSDHPEKYLLDVALRAMQDTNTALGN